MNSNVPHVLYGLGSIVAVCSGKHGDYVRTLGATDVIDYRTEDISAGLKRASTESDGFDYVLDCVGSDTAQAAVDSLRYGVRSSPQPSSTYLFILKL